MTVNRKPYLKLILNYVANLKNQLRMGASNPDSEQV